MAPPDRAAVPGTGFALAPEFGYALDRARFALAGRAAVAPPAWQLGLSWEQFPMVEKTLFYWPGQDYPVHRDVHRVGDWAIVSCD